jgi:hypothetical protein
MKTRFNNGRIEVAFAVKPASHVIAKKEGILVGAKG